MNTAVTMVIALLILALVNSLPVVKDVDKYSQGSVAGLDTEESDGFIAELSLWAQNTEYEEPEDEPFLLDSPNLRQKRANYDDGGVDVSHSFLALPPEIAMALHRVYLKKGGTCTLLNGYHGNPLYVIGRCPLQTPPSNIQELCENNPYSRSTENAIDLQLTPVQDENGLVYKNIYCAQCNHVIAPVFWSMQLDCDTHLPLEVSDGTRQVGLMKEFNTDHRDCVKRLSPAIERNLHECQLSDVVENQYHKAHRTRMGTGNKNSDTSPFPLSFSILMNFGFDGKTHILFSATPEDTVAMVCQSNEIYDIVNNKCRVVSCNNGYELVEGNCRKVENFESDEYYDLTDMGEAAQVKLTLKNVSYGDIYMLNLPGTEEVLVDTLSDLFNISMERIVNLTVGLVNNSNPLSSGNNIIEISHVPFPEPARNFPMVNKDAESSEESAETPPTPTTNDKPAVNVYSSDGEIKGENRMANINELSNLNPDVPTGRSDGVGSGEDGGIKSSVSPVISEVSTSGQLPAPGWDDVDTHISLQISFMLLPAHKNRTRTEKSVKNIVDDMSNLVYRNHFMLTVNGTELKVHSVENAEKPQDIDVFCMNGNLTHFDGSQFKVVKEFDSKRKTNVTNVVLLETGESFCPGEYDLTVSYTGYVANLSNGNMDSFVFICIMPKLRNQECGRIALTRSEYTKLENSSLLFLDHLYNTSEYEYDKHGDDVVRICAPDWSSQPLNYNQSRWALACGDDLRKLVVAESYLTFILGIVSLVAMLTVLVTYGIFEKLRNLPGINTINLTLSLFLGELVFIVSGTVLPSEDWLCSGVGMLLHYLFLASFFWMNVMSYDVYRTFAKKCILTRVRSKGRYVPRYALYAWGCPLLIVAFCALLDFSELFDGVRVGYGGATADSGSTSPSTAESSNITVSSSQSHMYSIGCWIQEPVASMAAFGGPMMLILGSNFVMFTRTIICIRASTKMVKVSVRRSSLSHMTGHDDVMLYVRMSTVMGFTWIFGLASSVVSAFAGPPSKTICIVLHLFGILFIVFNCSQGLFIFFAFVFNRRVAGLYRALYVRCRGRQRRSYLDSYSSRTTLATRSSQLSVSHIT